MIIKVGGGWAPGPNRSLLLCSHLLTIQYHPPSNFAPHVLFFFYRLHCTVFYPKLLFIVCCTAFSIHICLFTRAAILLGIESIGTVIGRWRWRQSGNSVFGINSLNKLFVPISALPSRLVRSRMFCFTLRGGSVAEWLACWTQAQ